MAKNDLQVVVPSYFRCPISLEVMKSPVALSTGITYDRSSIQTWLDAGNLTCPATRQPLPSADFVPNLSLHRLIHLWSLSLSSPRSPSPSPSPRHRLYLLMNRITTAANFKELSLHLSSLLHLARDSKENRDALANSERFVSLLVDLICKFDLASGENEFPEIALLVLDLVLRDSKWKDKIQTLVFNNDLKCFALIASVLRAGKTESRIAAANVLEAIAIDTESKRKIAESQGLVSNLYGLVTSGDDKLTEAGLSTLITLTTTKPLKSELIRLGIVRALGKILSGIDRTNSTVVKAMEMAELLATSSAGRLAICDDEKIVAEILKRLIKVSEKATEHGITVLWSVCYLFRNKKAVATVAENNGLAKCLLVMQSKCSAIVKQMCRDLVKVLRVDSPMPGLASYETKTTHIMPC